MKTKEEKSEYHKKWWRDHHPNARPIRAALTPVTKDFILENVTVKKDTGCWVWKRSKSKGYGTVWDGIINKRIQVHRRAWELWIGPVPNGLWVLHDCPGGDNKACCNPTHMFLGNNSDNIKDAIEKGVMRHLDGRLTREQILGIRSSLKRNFEIASEFGVSRQYVTRIRQGEIYARVK